MLIQEKIELDDFSANERLVLDFIVEKQEAIASYTTASLSKETYTAPSTMIRIAKKLGYSGWLDFKEAFLKEVQYLNSHFEDVDANVPFNKDDSILTISNKLAKLKKESIEGTQSLMDPEAMEKAVNILKTKDTVKVFCLSNIIFIAEEFVHRLRHINKRAEVYITQNTLLQEAVMTTDMDCTVFISYTGESAELFKPLEFLRQHNVPIIAITSIGNNTLSDMADVTLNITTRERAYSKIGGFSSLESIALTLDTLYASFFATNYEVNFEYKKNLARLTEWRQVQNSSFTED